MELIVNNQKLLELLKEEDEKTFKGFAFDDPQKFEW
jgi:hypothetical protein